MGKSGGELMDVVPSARSSAYRRQSLSIPDTLPELLLSPRGSPTTSGSGKMKRTSKVHENSPLLPRKGSVAMELAGGPKVQRTVGILAASAIVFGNCVGAGVFISPKGVYEAAGSAGGGLLVWVLSGVLATVCNLAYAELGTMMGDSGGEFVYINKTFGRFPAFMFSFSNSFLIKPASLAVLAMTFSEYLATLIWRDAVMNPLMLKSMGVSLIVLIMVINIMGSKLVVKFCSVASLLKLILVAFLVVCGIVVAANGQCHKENFAIDSTFSGAATNPVSYGMSFYYCLFSYQAWNSLNYMTEELKRPEVTLPMGGLLGLTGVTVSYVLANVSYLIMFSMAGLSSSSTIAMDSGRLAFGRVGELIMCVGLLVSVFGCLGGSVLCVSRNIQCTAQKGVFPTWMGGTNKTFNSPVAAILTFGSMIVVYMFVDASVLIPCLGIVEWLFYGVAFAALLLLRYREPTTHRPVKVPLGVGIFLFLVTVVFVLLPFFSAESRITAALGLGTLPIGASLFGVKYLFDKYCDPSATKREKYYSDTESEDSGCESGPRFNDSIENEERRLKDTLIS